MRNSDALTYDLNSYSSPEFIRALTGVEQHSIVELYRNDSRWKGEGRKTKVPVLYSCHSHAKDNKSILEGLGKGQTRNYYQTELIFIVLNEQFKHYGLSKKDLSAMYNIFTYEIEGRHPTQILKDLATEEALIGRSDYLYPKKAQKPENKGKDEYMEWFCSISVTSTGLRIADFRVEHYFKKGSTKETLGSIKIAVSCDLDKIVNNIEEYQTGKISIEKAYIGDSASYEISSKVEFNLSLITRNLIKKIKEYNTNQFG
jgi:hypothetical protein